MPKKLVVEYECDRCNRVWYENYTEGEQPPETNSLSVTLKKPDAKSVKEIQFSVMCESCTKTVTNLLASLSKLEKKSPEVKAKEEPKDSPKAKHEKPTQPKTADTSSAPQRGASPRSK